MCLPENIEKDAYISRVSVTQFETEPPEDFKRAIAGMQRVVARPEIELSPGPTPRKCAAWAASLQASLEVGGEDLGGGKFVLMYDPAGRDEWDGLFRITVLADVTIDPDFATEPMLNHVGWSWLTDALALNEAQHHHLQGAVTYEVTDWFGHTEERPTTVDLSVRASWTPTDFRMNPHVTAWLDTICAMAGMPPLPEGVSVISRK